MSGLAKKEEEEGLVGEYQSTPERNARLRKKKEQEEERQTLSDSRGLIPDL
jgi:hypothetical protein